MKTHINWQICVFIFVFLNNFLSLTNSVFVRFTKTDFGNLTEQENNFIELEVKREGKISSPFTVIIQVNYFLNNLFQKYKI